MLRTCKTTLLSAIVLFLLCSCGFRTTTDSEPSPDSISSPSAVNTDTETQEKPDVTLTIRESDLVGFWYDAPFFSEGAHETYQFFDGGDFDYRSADGAAFRGFWHIYDGNILELAFEEEYVAPSQNYAVQCTEKETGVWILTMNDKEFWRMNEPKDVINGIPLYIEYASGYLETGNRRTKETQYFDYGTGGEHIIISYDGALYDLMVCTVSVDDDFSFHYDSWCYAVAPYLFSDKIIDFTATISEGIPSIAVAFTDGDRNSYSYVLSESGRDGSLVAIKTDIFQTIRDNESMKTSLDKNKTVTVTFCQYEWEGHPFDFYSKENWPYVTEEIPTEDFIDNMAALMFLHNGIRIDNIWYEGNRLCVDLSAIESYVFNQGSSMGSVRTNELILTFASLPHVEEIEVLVGGQRGCGGDHFNFEDVFVVSEWLSRFDLP